MTSQLKKSLPWAILAASVGATNTAVAEYTSGFSISPRFEYQHLDSEQPLDNPFLGGLGLGYLTASPWAFELTYMRGQTERATSSDSVTLDLLRLDALYRLTTNEAVQPFLLIGGGKQRYDYGSFDIANDMINLGLGVNITINSNLAFRTDLRLINDMENELTSYALGMGLSFLLGSTSPAPRQPEPPAVVAPADADGDGVPDGRDRCPGTAPGVAVDEYGCELVQDDDGDGVPNHLDQCPDTQAGAKVDARGCYIVISETVEETLNIVFANNSADVDPAYYSEVEKIARFMREHPETEVVIEGHTDNVGSVEHNFRLSQSRADAAAEVLVQHFGIDAARVRATSFGPTQPVAANDTPQNRALNRRVVAKVSARVERFQE